MLTILTKKLCLTHTDDNLLVFLIFVILDYLSRVYINRIIVRIMKLNTKSRYAVMALADMSKFPSNNPVSLRDISLRQSISLLYLEQIFLKLKKNDIVKSVRGINGGYVLIRDPKKIKLSEIFQALDQKVKTVGCKKDSKKGCNGKASKCITHELWDELEIYINNFFENKKLSDLLINKERNN